jgi:anti-anti-sigma regulatory factor
MLRITVLNANGAPAIVKLEGKLLEPWISELQEACRVARKHYAAATLDLAGLSYIDASGAIALRDLMRRGVVVTGCSPLITELLKETLR